jgi:cyanate permease
VNDAKYRWIILTLSTTTAALGVAMPTMAMPVLFAEIAGDLGLTLVQIGAVWGTVSLAGLLAGLAGGVLGDRIGVKRTLAVGCVLLGAAGASQGLSDSLATLTVTVFVTGLVLAVIPTNLHKACAHWFSDKSLGVANAAISAAMALGFTVGSLVSATVLSPWLGGWRHVLFFYGAIAAVLSVPWALTRNSAGGSRASSEGSIATSLREALFRIFRLRALWALGIALLGIGGAVRGLLGYLPLYLRNIGWAPARADGALAGFHATSLLFVLPLAVLGGRLEERRYLLIGAAALVAAGIGLLSVAQGAIIWVAILMVGAVRDAYMATFITTVTELRAVGAANAGTALGLIMTLLRLGGLIAPPLGNSLAEANPRLPFVLWGAMALLGLCALLVRIGRARRPDAASEHTAH